MKYQKPEVGRMSEAIKAIQNPPQGKVGSPSDNVQGIDRLTVNAYDADE